MYVLKFPFKFKYLVVIAGLGILVKFSLLVPELVSLNDVDSFLLISLVFNMKSVTSPLSAFSFAAV